MKQSSFMTRSMAAVALALLSSLVAAASAAAGSYPAFTSCIGQDSTSTSCPIVLPSGTPGFGYPVKLVASPDGADAYAIADGPWSLYHFHRAADGSLTFADCIVAVAQGSGCTTLPSSSDALSGPQDIVLSPDGNDLYVVSWWGNQVAHFRIGNGGTPQFADCIGGDSGCTPLPENSDALKQPVALAISPDGHDLYTATQGDDAVVHLRRGADGTLGFSDCVAGGAAICSTPPYQCVQSSCGTPAGLSPPVALAVAAASRSVYVAGNAPWGSGALTHLRTDTSGRLSWADCVGGQHCVPWPANVEAGGLSGVAATPDGSNVYATGMSNSGAELFHFAAGADGALSFADCYGEDPTSGCVRVSQKVLMYASSPAVAGDGKTIYTYSPTEASVAAFPVGSGGALGQASCVGMGLGCFPAFLDGSNTEVATISPDGSDVYAPSWNQYNVFQLRSSPPTYSGGQTPAATTTAATSVSFDSATLNGTIARGPFVKWHFEWGTTTKYDGGDYNDGLGGGNRNDDWPASLYIGGLAPRTTYHYRLVASSPSGVSYGNDMTFTTTDGGEDAPQPTTYAFSAGTTAATAVVSVKPNGLPTSYQFQYGPTTSYGSVAAVGPGTLPGDFASHRFTGPLTGLQPGTTYHYRVVATNSHGQTATSDYTFTTDAAAAVMNGPAVITGPATAAAPTSETLNGSVVPYSWADASHFEYGTDVNYGSRTPDTPLTSGSTQRAVAAPVAGLAPNTLYHYRLDATGPYGYVYGPDETFTTPASAPPPSGAGSPPTNGGQPPSGSEASSGGQGSATAAESGGGSARPVIFAPSPQPTGAHGRARSAQLTVRLQVPATVDREALRAHGVRILVRCSRSCRIRATLTLRTSDAAPPRSAVVIGAADRSRPARAFRLTIVTDRRGRRALARVSTAVFVVTVSARSGGVSTTVSKTGVTTRTGAGGLPAAAHLFGL